MHSMGSDWVKKIANGSEAASHSFHERRYTTFSKSLSIKINPSGVCLRHQMMLFITKEWRLDYLGKNQRMKKLIYFFLPIILNLFMLVLDFKETDASLRNGSF